MTTMQPQSHHEPRDQWLYMHIAVAARRLSLWPNRVVNSSQSTFTKRVLSTVDTERLSVSQACPSASHLFAAKVKQIVNKLPQEPGAALVHRRLLAIFYGR